MSFAALAKHEREIGHVVAVTGTKVVLELYPEEKSPVHSYPGGLSVVAQIGAYLLFPVGAGDSCVGVLTGAYEHEGYEPTDRQGMTLQLAKPRRTLHANLLGTLTGERNFEHGVTVYPSLGTVALIPSQEQLRAILSEPATARDPEGVSLELGDSPIYGTVQVAASLDDLFSRPLAIVGNTGSGKSWTVAALIQRCMALLGGAKEAEPRFVVLDINGEYAAPFNRPLPQHIPDEVYANGAKFALPLWTFSLDEFVRFFGATTATATQVPVLERIITTAREQAYDDALAAKGAANPYEVRESLWKLERAHSFLRALRSYAIGADLPYIGANARAAFTSLSHILENLPPSADSAVNAADQWEAVKELLSRLSETDITRYTEERGGVLTRHGFLPEDISDLLRELHDNLDPLLQNARSRILLQSGLPTISADSPFPFDARRLNESDLLDRVLANLRGEERIREYIATLQLRIRRMLLDRRWRVFFDESPAELTDTLLPVVGGSGEAAQVIVVDCSMLAYDVLPFFCSVLGRVLLELREHGGASQRTRRPWVLVLEEAHNYLRPHRESEDAGVALSRATFERIAKEGRKFGLSLVIASQRPSEVSQTVLAQCANFIVHRIQNPDDIEYFRRILPAGFREVLDQVGVLVPGEALLMGSAVNVPSRVRIWPPSPPPRSEPPKPSVAWKRTEPDFDVAEAIQNWRGETRGAAEAKPKKKHLRAKKSA